MERGPCLVGRRSVLAGLAGLVAGACVGGGDADTLDGAETTRDLGTTTRRVVPQPQAMIRSNWSRDEYARGSYSFMAVGAEPSMRADLAEPIGDRLFFAGEATAAAAPATVHGAIESGARVASDVIGRANPGDTIIVIGAGAAGAQAARSLADAGFAVTVLEAKPQVGGRLTTIVDPVWPLPVELGASWLHDIEASDVVDRLASADVASVPFGYATAARLPSGERAADEFDEQVSDVIDAVGAAIEWAESLDQDVSITEAIERSGTTSNLDRSIVAYVGQNEVASEYGAELDELSAFWGFEEGSDGEDLLVTGGYVRILDELLAGLEIVTDAPVTSISYADRVVVTTASDAVWTADRVVVTVPLGVLKQGSIAFDPPLPAIHVRAIQSIGMGLLDKVWLVFDEPFWTESAQMWTIVGGNGIDEWFNLHAAAGVPVLLGLVGADRAREVAILDDEAVLELALASLQLFVDSGW